MIKIVAVDDSVEYLESLRLIFQPHKKEFNLVKCFSTFRDEDNVKYMLQKIGELSPDAVLMDFSFVLAGQPSDYGIELVRRIISKFPNQKIIMLVADDDDSDKVRWDKIRRSFAAGAHGYLSKRSIAGWRDAIIDVVRGEAYVNKNAIKAILTGLRKNDKKSLILSYRQIEVINELAKDKSLQQVADSIKGANDQPIKIHTVNFHLRNIRARLDCKTLHGVVAKAIRNKIIE